MEPCDSPIHGNDLLGESLVPSLMVEGATHIVRYANPAFCRLVDKTVGMIVGLELAASLPQYRECVALLNQVASTGRADSFTEQHSSSLQDMGWCYSAWPVRSAAETSSRTMLQISNTSDYRQQSTAINQALMVSAVRQHEFAEVAEDLAQQMRGEIAERKRSQEALQTSEARLVLALDSAKASTWEWDILANTLMWRDRDAPLSAESRKSCYRAWRSLVAREDWPVVDAAVKEMGDESLEVNVEFRLKPNSGVARWLLARGRLTPVENGTPLLYSGIFLDITERKYAEELLLRSEKLASVGRLAATLAHEINNPLDAAINCIYIAKTSPDVPEAIRFFLGTADEELRRVTHMTRQSLGFYREATVPSTFSVNLVIESVVQLLSNRIKGKSVKVDLHLTELPLVEGIFGELRQVFVNLVSNSLDAIEPCGTIVLKSSVGVDARSNQRRVRVTVADNGKGIASAQCARIFEPFFTTKGNLGTGLGLWVTKQIIEKHGGAVRVRSTTGGGNSGSVFSVTLPSSVV